MGTHNICFHGEVKKKKLLSRYLLFSAAKLSMARSNGVKDFRIITVKQVLQGWCICICYS